MLAISEEALAAKNEKCGGHLRAEMKGKAHEMFTKCLKGLSGAKVQTRSALVHTNFLVVVCAEGIF